MKAKKEISPILGSVIVLILVMGGGLLAWKWQLPKLKTVEPYFSDKVESFCVDQWCFKKSEGIWLMEIEGRKIPADEDKIDNFVEEMKQIRLDRLASNNPTSLGSMGLSDDDGVKVKANDKEVEVGNLGQDYSSTILRVPNASEAYLVAVTWNKLNLTNRKYWEKYRINNLPTLQISKISRNGKELMATDEMKGKLTHLEAISYIGNEIKQIGGKFDFVIEEEMKQNNLAIGQAELKGKLIYWATTDGKYYFEISKSDFTLLTTDKS